MVEITERREVRVRADDGTFVFAAEPEAGRLVIREQRDDGGQDELCALTIADRQELSGFLQGLRRVLGVAEDRASRTPGDQPADEADPSRPPEAARSRPALAVAAEQDGGSEARRRPQDADTDPDDRREAMERARARGQAKAFAPWSREEEQRLLDAVEAGRDLDELARAHQRSRRALELRLDRLRQ